MVEHKQVYIFGAMFHKGEGTRHIEGHSRGILTVTYRQPPRTQTHGTPPPPRPPVQKCNHKAQNATHASERELYVTALAAARITTVTQPSRT